MTTATVAEPSVLTRPVGIEVFGDPKPKGSLVCRRDPFHTLREQVKGVDRWRRLIEKHAHELGGPYEGPVRLRVVVTLAFPKSSRASERLWPHVRGTGDSDKFMRAVGDSLEAAGVLGNDAQIVDEQCIKAYPHSPCVDVLTRPGARIRLLPMDGLTPAQPTPPADGADVGRQG